jgi:hypothetical protein
MAITSIVGVADGTGTVNIDDVQAFTFTPGGEYPAEVKRRLYIKSQPFPRIGPPTQVVPAVVGAWLSYGKYGDQPQQPPPFEPEEHALREFTFNARYVDGSWQVSGSEASLEVSISAGVMDNTPSGEPPEPDDPFAARVDVRALCIWTTEVTLLDLLAEFRPFFLRKGA